MNDQLVAPKETRDDQPGITVTVIIPVLNGGQDFRDCLAALGETQAPRSSWECIVVDDGSSDGSVQAAVAAGAQVFSTPRSRSGPALARNIGAERAKGKLLYFVDADVLVKPENIDQVIANLSDPAGPVACFGSYDDEPAVSDFLSLYKNLQHHFVHQTAERTASTFWSGCGAIRRDIFLQMGGFSTAYRRPSIEDIELGYRLRAAGHTIRLDRTLQVKHLKRWTVRGLLVTDIRDRAIPWSRLILRDDSVLNDLNLQTGQRISTVCVYAGLGSSIMGFRWPRVWFLLALLVPLLLLLNWRFYIFLARKRGLGFAVKALPWHWLYFFYSGLVFGLVLLEQRLSTRLSHI